MNESSADSVRNKVRQAYAAIAVDGNNSGCCQPAAPSSSCEPAPTAEDFSRNFGYSADDLAAVPDGSNMGLGCGNPLTIASLRDGEVVLDLGSGGGFDCFLAAKQVGDDGRVIGVDMTPEMLAKSRRNARERGFRNVEFRLGEIEHLPVADSSVDVVISNCVLNLSPDKPRVLREAYRVLAPGGRLSIHDVVATAAIPDEIARDDGMLSGCISGAASVRDLAAWLADAGFSGIRITVEEESRDVIKNWAPGSGVEKFVASAAVEATKNPT